MADSTHDGRRQIALLCLQLESLRPMGREVEDAFLQVYDQLVTEGDPAPSDWESFSPENIKSGRYKVEASNTTWSRILCRARDALANWWETLDKAIASLDAITPRQLIEERLAHELRLSTRVVRCCISSANGLGTRSRTPAMHRSPAWACRPLYESRTIESV